MNFKDKLKERVSKLRNKKAFTLIELIVVIAILGILVLIAAPKFLGYTSDAKMAQVKNDIKAYENAITAKLTYDPKFTDGWVAVPKEDLEKFRDEDTLFNTRGEVKDDYVFKGEFIDIPEEDLKDIKSKLPGNFIWGSDGKVYYQDENVKDNGNSGNTPSGGNNSTPPGGNTTPPVVDPNKDTDGDGIPDKDDQFPNDPEKSGLDTDNDGLDDAYENTVSKTDPTKKDTDGDFVDDKKEIEQGTDPLDPNDFHPDVVATDADFQWVSSPNGYYTKEYPTTLGYYAYKGVNQPVVAIPNVIKGTEMTSYAYMFYNTGSLVKKVISVNPNIESTQNMFNIFRGSSLDLSEFNTSGLKNMDSMFAEFKGTSLDISNFDTSKVTNMNRTFYYMTATTNITGLDKLDTSNVTTMSAMFSWNGLTTLDVSNLNTSKVTNMSSMFLGSYATTLTGLDKLDTSNVTDMSNMFNASKATSLDLSNFNTSKVTDMSRMFYEYKADTLDLTAFDLSKVSSTDDMFYNSRVTDAYAKDANDVTKLNNTKNRSSRIYFKTK